MKKTALIIAAILTASVAFGAVNRTLVETNDLSEGYYQNRPIKAFQAESIDYTIYAQRNGVAVDLSGDVYPVWFLVDKVTNSTSYWAITGTVSDATGGVVNITVTPSESNVNPGRYKSIVRLYEDTNTFIETISARYIDMQASPDSDTYNVVPPIRGAVSLPTNDWVDGYVVGSVDGVGFEWVEGGSGSSGFPLTNDVSAAWFDMSQFGTASGSNANFDLFTGDGAGLTNLSAYTKGESDALFATGTPLYVESDPIWLSEKSSYATGTPLYAYTETDPVFTNVASVSRTVIGAFDFVSGVASISDNALVMQGHDDTSLTKAFPGAGYDTYIVNILCRSNYAYNGGGDFYVGVNESNTTSALYGLDPLIVNSNFTLTFTNTLEFLVFSALAGGAPDRIVNTYIDEITVYSSTECIYSNDFTGSTNVIGSVGSVDFTETVLVNGDRVLTEESDPLSLHTDGGTMTGALTNNVGFYGDGSGVTNAPYISNNKNNAVGVEITFEQTVVMGAMGALATPGFKIARYASGDYDYMTLTNRTLEYTGPGGVIADLFTGDGAGLTNLPVSSTFHETNMLYVAPNGDDANSGKSIEQPFLTPQHAINVGSAIRQGGGSRSTIHIAAGSYGIPVMPTTITWSNGVNIKGSFDRDTILFANVVTDTNITDGGTMSDLTIMNMGSVAKPLFEMPTGTSPDRQVRLHNVSLALPAVDDFGAPVVKIDGGWLELSGATFSIAECAFTNTGLGHTYDFIAMSGNDTRVMIKNSRMESTTLHAPVTDLNIFKKSGFGISELKDNSFNFVVTNGFAGHFHVAEFEGGYQNGVYNNIFVIRGMDDSQGSCSPVVVRTGATVRVEGNTITSSGMNTSRAGACFDGGTLWLNRGSEMSDDGWYFEDGAEVKYAGTPGDGFIAAEGFIMGGPNGELITTWPKWSAVKGLTGHQLWNFSGIADAVYTDPEADQWNNAIEATATPDTFNGIDVNGAQSSIIVTRDGWYGESAYGYNIAGGTYPRNANDGAWRTRNPPESYTGHVHYAGLVVGGVYTARCFSSYQPLSDTSRVSRTHAKTQEFWVASGSYTSPKQRIHDSWFNLTNVVDFVFTNQTATTLTNLTIFCQGIGDTSRTNSSGVMFDVGALNVVELFGGAQSGMLPTSGETPMEGSLDMGGNMVTNASDGTYTGTLATVEYVDASGGGGTAGVYVAEGSAVTATNVVGDTTTWTIAGGAGGDSWDGGDGSINLTTNGTIAQTNNIYIGNVGSNGLADATQSGEMIIGDNSYVYRGDTIYADSYDMIIGRNSRIYAQSLDPTTYGCIAIGNDIDITPVGCQDVVIGNDAGSVGAGAYENVVIGWSALAAGRRCVAIGWDSYAGGSGSPTAIGMRADAREYSVAIGSSADANNTSVAVGYAAGTVQSDVAIGAYAKTDSGGVSIGRMAGNYGPGAGTSAIAIGMYSGTTSNSMAIGVLAQTPAYSAHAIGTYSSNNVPNSTVISAWDGSAGTHAERWSNSEQNTHFVCGTCTGYVGASYFGLRATNGTYSFFQDQDGDGTLTATFGLTRSQHP